MKFFRWLGRWLEIGPEGYGDPPERVKPDGPMEVRDLAGGGGEELVEVELGHPGPPGGCSAFSVLVSRGCSRIELGAPDGVAVYVRGEGEPFRFRRFARFGEISEEEIREGQPWLAHEAREFVDPGS